MSSDVKNSTLMSRPTGLIIGVVVIFLLLGAGVWWLLRTDYEPLMSESNIDSRQEILSMLMEWKVPYKVEDGTGIISIPSDQISEIRSRLSGMGLPATQIPGLEVFQQSDYGMSEFAQKINYQRGLEGELARTIRTFEEVKSARVHLSLAKNSLFENRKEPAKASVVLQLKPNRNLTKQQVSGIQQLISSAIIGLNPEEVVVLDEFGKTLTTEDASDADRWSTIREMEREYEERGRKLIVGILPGSQVNISVKLQANFDRVKSIKETLIPVSADKGFLVKKREQIISGKSPTNDSNISTQNNNTIETEYIYGKEHSEIEYASGVITNISIGVVVANETVSQDLIDKVRIVLLSGLGLSEARGDTISIVGSKLEVKNDSEEINKYEPVSDYRIHEGMKEEPKLSENNFDNLWILGVVAFIVVCLMVIFSFRLRKNNSKSEKLPLTAREREELLMELRTWLAQDKNGTN